MDKVRTGMSTPDRRCRLDGLERKQERQDWGGFGMYGGNMMGILGKDAEDGAARKEGTYYKA